MVNDAENVPAASDPLNLGRAISRYISVERYKGLAGLGAAAVMGVSMAISHTSHLEDLRAIREIKYLSDMIEKHPLKMSDATSLENFASALRHARNDESFYSMHRDFVDGSIAMVQDMHKAQSDGGHFAEKYFTNSAGQIDRTLLEAASFEGKREMLFGGVTYVSVLLGVLCLVYGFKKLYNSTKANINLGFALDKIRKKKQRA